MKHFYLTETLLLFFLVTSLSAQPVSQTFNSSGSWTIPAGYSANITVHVWGGGGGGITGIFTSARGGGGGGAYARSTIDVTGPTTYTVTVGAAVGAATDGNNSSFGNIVIAIGGKRAIAQAGGNGGMGSTGDVVFNGGKGGNGGSNTGGGGGGSATSSVAGSSGANGSSGGAGGAGQGKGGNGGVIGLGSSGGIGQAPGGGGGGAGASIFGSGGGGAAGRVMVVVNSVLPVELVSFTGKAAHESVHLNWSTAQELNNEKFEIERSRDGRNFQKIGEVMGEGTTVEAQDYYFEDKTPFSGTNYYRLRQLDFDGQFEFSPVIHVEVQKANAVTLFPTVSTGIVQIRCDEELSGIQVFDQFGRSVLLPPVHTTVDLGVLPKGMYLVQIETESDIYCERVIKQ